MLKVDVESGRVLFLAEGIPLHEPLLHDDEKSLDTKKKHALFGCFLLAVATFSTIAMVFFFILYPKHDDGVDMPRNNTGFVLPFVEEPLGWMDDNSSPQYEAMEWMMDADMKVETTSIMERFALVVLFMTTNGAHKWTASLGFLSHNTSVCDWNNGKQGVFCDSGRKSVVKILLSNMNLDGSIPAEMSYLSSLEVLDLANNRLKGNLPMAVSSMELLSKVNLEGNLSDFAGNVNHVLCSGALKKINGLEVLMGKKDCSSCLCCTECPDSPSNGDY